MTIKKMAEPESPFGYELEVKHDEPKGLDHTVGDVNSGDDELPDWERFRVGGVPIESILRKFQMKDRTHRRRHDRDFTKDGDGPYEKQLITVFGRDGSRQEEDSFQLLDRRKYRIAKTSVDGFRIDKHSQLERLNKLQQIIRALDSKKTKTNLYKHLIREFERIVDCLDPDHDIDFFIPNRRSFPLLEKMKRLQDKRKLAGKATRSQINYELRSLSHALYEEQSDVNSEPTHHIFTDAPLNKRQVEFALNQISKLIDFVSFYLPKNEVPRFLEDYEKDLQGRKVFGERKFLGQNKKVKEVAWHTLNHGLDWQQGRTEKDCFNNLECFVQFYLPDFALDHNLFNEKLNQNEAIHLVNNITEMIDLFQNKQISHPYLKKRFKEVSKIAFYKAKPRTKRR